MRILRFSCECKVRYGLLDRTEVHGLRGTPLSRLKSGPIEFRLDGSCYDLEDVRLLSPVRPSKIVAVGLNYRSHAEETMMQLPASPLIFLKPSTAVVGPEEDIVLPRSSRRVDYEGELGVVIGRKAKDVPREQAAEYVLGYTCVNDVSERHFQKVDGQWARAKGFDTFAPIGPWIETDVDFTGGWLTTKLNGEVRQSACLCDLIFGVPELVEFVSGVMTLLPGDVISTGTPAGIGPMKAGDVVEVTIDGIGTLRNRAVAAE